MKVLPLTLALLLLGPATIAQETLRRVRITAVDAPALAAAFQAQGLDVLEGSVGPGSLELVVTVQQQASLTARGLAPELLEIGQPFAAKQAADGGVPEGYPDLAGIYAAMNLAEAGFPNLARVVDLTATYGMPTTFEGRSLLALRISDNVDTDEDEPALLVVSGHHCRELVTPVIALELAKTWLNAYGSDPAITAAIDENELWIAPIWNPDGYEHVFQVDNLWRKNRRVLEADIGVDLNRNYPQGWAELCSGSADPSSELYKGPTAGSEAETQTMLAFANDRHFARVIDFHSYGEEVLWSYACSTHPFDAFLQTEAAAFSTASGYGGAERRPSAEGEHYQWDLAQLGTHSFLVEAHTTFQPTYADALAEAAKVIPGVLWMAQREAAISGHVTDACTGAPLEASISFVGVPFTEGEANKSGGPFARYRAFVPDGSYTLRFSAPGFTTQGHSVTVPVGGSTTLNVALTAVGAVTISGTAQPGTTVQVDFDMPADPSAAYIAGAGISGTMPGIPIGGCNLPINPDFLTVLSSTNQYPFTGFAGLLDATGHAAGTLDLPPTPVIVGIAIDLAFLTLDPITGAFLHTSAGAGLTVQP